MVLLEKIERKALILPCSAINFLKLEEKNG
jgi:hypothetical protein